jgi:hypothetical protein
MEKEEICSLILQLAIMLLDIRDLKDKIQIKKG